MATARSLVPTLVAALALLGLPAAAPAQGTPAVDYESILESYFDDDNGQLSFTTFELVLAPDGPCEFEVAVLDAEGKQVARHGSYEDYRWREGVFARVNMRVPADVKLSQPGLYTLVFLHGGKPITRFQFVLVQTGAGDDPYDPVTTYRFDGPWRMFGHVTTHDTFDGARVPRFTVWLGGPDLPAGEERGGFKATLLRGDELVAHSKSTQGHIGSGHFERTDVTLFLPHEIKREANAGVLKLADLADGDYHLKLSRKSDDAPLRDFSFSVKGGELVPHPRSDLKHEPAYDHLAPRVVKRGANMYQFVPTTWIESPLVY